MKSELYKPGLFRRSNRVLISGDPIQRPGRIFMFGSHRSLEAYIRSLEHLEAYLGRFDEIWPSHAEFPVPPETVRQLRHGAQAVLNGEVPGTAAEIHGTPITEYDLGFCVLLCNRLPEEDMRCPPTQKPNPAEQLRGQ